MRVLCVKLPTRSEPPMELKDSILVVGNEYTVIHVIEDEGKVGYMLNEHFGPYYNSKLFATLDSDLDELEIHKKQVDPELATN